MSVPPLALPSRFRQNLNSEPSSSSSSPCRSAQVSALSLAGRWYITRSSSPFWRDKHGVSITFSLDAAQKSTESDSPPVYTTQTAYRTSAESSGSTKTVSGTDRRVATADGNGDGNDDGSSAIVMEWRGSGWLRIARTRWEILGFGGGSVVQWIVVYAEKSMVTPAGISVYSREREMGDQSEREMQDALARMIEGNSSEELARLVRDIGVIGV
ncbi:hypothetical protein BDW59DRAFT_166944 [Aspergillus cavernicola]|uniref:Lipocalin-like domain-containing protein n=1 Tax=Aspergillus cavernicola TaxID=176166 RepID=A0ABR4HHQ9_9EURO